MLRRSPRTVLLWSATAAVAVVTAGTVARSLDALHRHDRAWGPERPVLVATHDLARGATLRPADVTVRRARGTSVAPDTLRAARDASDRTVVVPVLRDEPVTRRHLAARHRSGLDGVVPPGLRAMRIAVDNGVRANPGDTVDLYATFDPTKIGSDAEPTIALASAAPVIAVDQMNATSAAGTPGERAAVTVLVDVEQAKRLAFADANGVLSVALAPPEDSDVTQGAAHSG